MATIEKRQARIKDGRQIEIRTGTIEDASGVLALATSVIGEEIYQLTSAEEFKVSLEDEKKWIHSLEGSPTGVLLVAECKREIVGILDFSASRPKRTSHTGMFGMSVAKSFRNLGVGAALVSALLDWAKSNGGIEKVCLQVHGNNLRAQSLYKKFGFEIEGIKKKDLKYGSGEYVDSVLMAKFI